MFILNHELSIKAEKISNEIMKDLHKPIQFKNIDKGHISDSNGYVLDDAEYFYVHIKKELKQDVFESILIHELLHCVQKDAGSPGLMAKKYGDSAALGIASLINAALLDIDVEDQLFRLKMHSDEVDNNRYNDSIESIDFYNNTEIRDYYMISAALFLVLIDKTSANPDHYLNLVNLYKSIDYKIIELFKQIYNIIDQYGVKTPQQQCRSMRRVAIASGWRDRLTMRYNGFDQDI